MNAVAGLSPRIIETILPNQEVSTQIPDLTLYRSPEPTEKYGYMQFPGICLVLQGSKEVQVGDQRHDLIRNQFVCYPVDVPLVSRVSAATAEVPYIGLSMRLDPHLLTQILAEMSAYPAPSWQTDQEVGTLTPALGDAFRRLLQLLSTPRDIPVLAPLVTREIYYRVLQTPQGNVLRALVSDDRHIRLIVQSIAWMKQNLAETMEAGDIAARLSMSQSSFYRHFRRLTSMSPLQYLKSLRLTEARRMIRQRDGSITAIAQRVGYESPSQFSREYKRVFGNAPREDWADAAP